VYSADDFSGLSLPARMTDFDTAEGVKTVSVAGHRFGDLAGSWLNSAAVNGHNSNARATGPTADPVVDVFSFAGGQLAECSILR
jgi:hypothetical protein